ncbi:MAG: bifunctional 1-(5-phosphoribosyl)-5-((5-phosphoribosylamino)methylideneamino)imidazole-4-carboxamide isomerase/phosphoribosylanthranilate isomerase PriA [Varibaculum sp.]|nr:bifunctional 1-(5-phosphoribosyl)-5-((5-phosphoribosylamino)methylideneamino)imidazole-4-carboxamide isomerase/phosphoribosylanthranilate isomerase PriA [Varibaculum sp.]
MIVFPAIDIVSGQAVRLTRGEAGSETVYGEPLEMARTFLSQGASWLHIVDLDAAFGRGSNAELCRAIASAVDIQVEVTGGIRDDASLKEVLDAGAARAGIGTAALEKPDWTERVLAEHGEKISVGLDIRDGRVAGRGWTSDGGDTAEVLYRLENQGAQRYVVTDISRDGMLSGPNIELYQQLRELTDKPIVASGGIGSLDDVYALAENTDVEGVIIGKALYSSAFTLPEALAAANA